uniref:Lipocalin n=1 Tax=Rhipicephalus zambeziensis TaxID=60191 RepID=A0A224YMZ8_9ACAR
MCLTMAARNEAHACSVIAFSILITWRLSGADYVTPSSEEYDYDIRKFLNTSETIWTLNTTSEKLQMCKSDLKQNMNETEIFFRRKHQGSEGELLQGQFLLNKLFHEYDSMDVGKPGALSDREEIIFRGYNNTCAIFKTTLLANVIIYFSYNQREIIYELRVTDSSVDNPDKECFEEFDYVARSRKTHVPYASWCRRLMRKPMHA